MDIIRKKGFLRELTDNFGHVPTADQELAIGMFADFCFSLNARELMILKGYAGTGKTSLIKSLVKTLPAHKRKVALLAPTGRAAKVMTHYTGKVAYTIHKYIYQPKKDRRGATVFRLRENKAVNTIYVVDEASMITDLSKDSSLTSTSLLSDLIEFVTAGVNCKLLLVGDTAQLPPVGSDNSPALDGNYLGLHYRMESFEIEMTTVMRQSSESAILSNATVIRNMLAQSEFEIPKISTATDLVRLLEGYEIEDALNQSFKEVGREGTSIIVRSNKRANLYNQQIRSRVLWQENEISSGDYLMVVKNNYFWLPEKSRAGFIANGDIIELLRVYDQKELYGFRFAKVQVRMVDYPDEPHFDTVIMLDTLNLSSPSLPWPEAQQLYQRVLEDYMDIPQVFKRHKEVQNNEYFNALQVKFAYAVTCHKAQGGQWDNVFIEQPWLPEDQVTEDYLRWLYTAITRAKNKVYLMGFKDQYFTD